MVKSFFKSRYWAALRQFLYTNMVLLGLSFLAWGLDALPTFFSNPARATFSLVVLLQALVNAGMAYVSPTEPKHEHREHRLDLASWHSFMFEAIFVLAAFGDRRNILAWEENLMLRWVGLGVYLIGYAFSVWTNLTWIKHLQREGPRAMEHPVLLFEGPFKRIRHPSMVYLVFYCLGFAILFRSWIGLVLIIPLIGGIINRINNLEKIFEVQYKNIWPLRRHTSKRLIPYLY
jgi:protein-S-isoprenylcysteine O-methyltransferase Ste14